MRRRKITLLVTVPWPEGMTRDDIKAYVRDALRQWPTSVFETLPDACIEISQRRKEVRVKPRPPTPTRMGRDLIKKRKTYRRKEE